MKNIPDKMPENFLWGGAVAACQIEGAFDVDNRGLSSSDIHPYSPELIKAVYAKPRPLQREGGGTRQEVEELIRNDKNYYFGKRYGIDFYHTYKEDLALMKELGLKAFRTSISWNRIFPNGDDEMPCEEGLKFYDNLIDEIIKDGMEPIITMCHYDIPLNLIMNYGGFANRKVTDLFVKYAKVILDRYKGKVKYWIVFNQINLVPGVQFGSLGLLEDQSDNMEQLMYQAIHNQMIATAKTIEAARIIDPNTKVGVMLAGGPAFPANCEPENIRYNIKQNRFNYFFTDVHFRGEYPGYAIRYFRDHDIHVDMEEDDEELLKKNTADFLACTHYSTSITDYKLSPLEPLNCLNVHKNPFLKEPYRFDPIGLYNSLSEMWDRYQKPIIVAESGVGLPEKFEDCTVHDTYRIEYVREHAKMLKECLRDGMEVIAYCMWGPIDIVSSSTCEMSKRYGFVYVDRDNYGNGTQKRYKKDSFYYYQKVIASNGEDLD